MPELKPCPFSGNTQKCIPYVRMEDAEGANKELLSIVQKLEKLNDELTEKVAHLEAAQTNWISVAERLPEDDAEVLTHAVDCNGGSAFAITSYTHHMHGYNIEGWCSPWQHFHNYYIVTHWMPLPEPPNDNGRD